MKSVAEQAERHVADHVLAHDALEHVVQKLDDRFKAVLGCAGNELHCLVALRAHQRTTRTTIIATSTRIR